MPMTTAEHGHARAASPNRPATRCRCATARRGRRAGCRGSTASAPRAYWIRPRSGPLWSSTMTSWIIVSSRCVVGSSTGMRLFSTSSRTSSVTATSASVGSAVIQSDDRRGPDRSASSDSAPVTRARIGQRKKKRRFGERREMHFAARAHALEAGAGIERRQHGREAAERQQPGEHDQIARKSSRAARSRPTARSEGAASSTARFTTGPSRNTQLVVPRRKPRRAADTSTTSK